MSRSVLNDPEYLRYVQEVQQYDLLTPEQEVELALKARDGDKRAAEALVTANLRFVIKIALQYRGYGMKPLDLIQEGNLGLMKAVEKFDPDRGFRLVTYAVHWIRAYVRAYILKNWSMVRVGSTHSERRLFYRLPKAKRELAGLDTDDPQQTLSALAKHLGATEAQVERAEQRIYGRDVSLATPLSTAENERTMEDVLPDDAPDPHAYAADLNAQGALRDAIDVAMEHLDDRQRYILRRRYLEDEKVTLQSIGDELGLSRERVRQLETTAKRTVQRALQAEAGDLVQEMLGA